MSAVIFALLEMGIYVVIVYVIIRTIKKKKRESLEHSLSRREKEFKPGMADYERDLDEILKGVTAPVNNEQRKVAADIKSTDIKPNDIKSHDTVTTDIKTFVSNSAATMQTGDDVGGSQKSTTDYLADKARQDQIDHAREKREEIKRLSQKSGGLFPAERLYDGDPVPNGKHCVICGYCAAENLIPNGAARKYSCYFCREPL